MSIEICDNANNPVWQLAVGENNELVIKTKIDGDWVEKVTLEQLTGLMNVEHLTVNRHSGMPFQYGLSIGCAAKNTVGSGGVNYIKMFSDDPLEEYMQVNIGMHTDPNTLKRMGFMECIEQSVRHLPFVVDPQNQSSFGVGAIPDNGVKLQLKTVDNAGAATSSRVAIRIDGGNLSNGWERCIQFTGNGASLVVGELSSWLSGLSRKLKIKSAGNVCAEANENGTFTHN